MNDDTQPDIPAVTTIEREAYQASLRALSDARRAAEETGDTLVDGTGLDYYQRSVERDKARYPLIDVPPLKPNEPVVIDMDRRRPEKITAEYGPTELPAPTRSAGTGYEDVEEMARRSLETAQMLASLRPAGSGLDPDATVETLERVRSLRLALGLGQVGQHFNAVGAPVADQVAVILSTSEVEALIMRLTGQVRIGKI